LPRRGYLAKLGKTEVPPRLVQPLRERQDRHGQGTLETPKPVDA